MHHLQILVSFIKKLDLLSQNNQCEPKAVYNAGPGMIKRPNVHLMKTQVIQMQLYSIFHSKTLKIIIH